MKKRRSTEQGQALLLIVFGMVVLLGFTALAIDGGMVYADRRHAQNGSDASSLAGGGAAALSLDNDRVFAADWNCGLTGVRVATAKAITAAINRAADNGFTIDTDESDGNGVTVFCGIDTSSYWPDPYLDIHTKVSMNTKTSFAHFVFGTMMRNTVDATTRVRPRTAVAFGHAVVALNDAPCSGNQNGVVFGGDSTINIVVEDADGDGVFSNGCLTGNGTSFTVDVTGGNVNYVGTATGNTGNISPAPSRVPEKLPSRVTTVPAPNCSGLPARTQSGSTIYPGVYDHLRLTNGSLNLQPGLYCLTGSPNAITVNGGTFTGHGVTLYVLNGSVSISGNAEVDLSAPYCPGYPTCSPGWDPSPALEGVLFYLARGNDGPLELEGNSTSAYWGQLYAPSADISILGTNDTTPTFHTQIIGNNVEISGNAILDIRYNGGENHTIPASLSKWR